MWPKFLESRDFPIFPPTDCNLNFQPIESRYLRIYSGPREPQRSPGRFPLKPRNSLQPRSSAREFLFIRTREQSVPGFPASLDHERKTDYVCPAATAIIRRSVSASSSHPSYFVRTSGKFPARSGRPLILKPHRGNQSRSISVDARACAIQSRIYQES